MVKSKKVCTTGYLVYLITASGKRYRFGVRKLYLETFIACAFSNNCTVEFVGLCSMPRNSGILALGDNGNNGK